MQTSIHKSPIKLQAFSSNHFKDLGKLHFTFFRLLCYVALYDGFVGKTDHLGSSLCH